MKISIDNFTHIFTNILITLPMSVATTGIFATIITGEYQYIFFSLLMLICDFINFILKKISRNLLEKSSYSFGDRPSICGNRSGVDCTGCGLYPKITPRHSWGMPSGHAQSTSFAATYWSLYLYNKYINDKSKGKTVSKQKMYILIGLIWMLTLFVWVQRVYSKCHSVAQVITGGVIGFGLGVGGYNLSKIVFPDLP